MSDRVLNKIKGVGAILIALILSLGLALPELQTMLAPGQDIYEINANEITEGAHITGKIDYVFDYYAVQSTSETTMGITTSTTDDTARWYIVPVYGESQEDPKLITVKVEPSGYYSMEKVVEETWAYLNGESDSYGDETYTLDARAVKLQYDLYPLYYEWYGIDYQEQADALLVPYALVPVEDYQYVVLLGSISLGLLIYGLYQLLRKTEKLQKMPPVTSAAAYDNSDPTEMRMDAYKPETYQPETYDPDDRYKRYDEE